MTPTTALYHLTQFPRRHLADALYSIVGGPLNQTYNFFIGTYQGHELRFGNANYAFYVSTAPVSMEASGRIQRQLHSFRMIQNHEALDITAIPFYTLDGGGPDIVVTGSLTGCSIVALRHAGTLLVAHIRPMRNIVRGGVQTHTNVSGLTLETELSNHGRFAGHPGSALTVYGASRYPSHRATVVGVRKGAEWRLYAQSFAGMLPNTTITNVTRII